MFLRFFKFGKKDKIMKKNPKTIKLIDKLISNGNNITWNNITRNVTFMKM